MKGLKAKRKINEDDEEDWVKHMQSVAARKRLPIRARRIVYRDSPVVVNMVSTTWLLEQGKGYLLPLHAASMMLGLCSQYAPNQFAANILRFTTSVAGSTALAFASGKKNKHNRDVVAGFLTMFLRKACTCRYSVAIPYHLHESIHSFGI